MAGKVVNSSLVLLSKFVTSGQESASKTATSHIRKPLFSNGENIEIENIKQGLGYVIDVTDGQIMYIEFTTYGENWNGIFGENKIVEKNENQ